MSDRLRLVVGATLFIVGAAAAFAVFAAYTADRETFAVVNTVERGGTLDAENLRPVQINTDEADQLLDAGTVAVWIAEGWRANGRIEASRWLRHGDFSPRQLPAEGSVEAKIPVSLPAGVTVGDLFRLYVEDGTLGTAPWPCRPSPEMVVATARAVGYPVLGWTAWHVLLAAADRAEESEGAESEGAESEGAESEGAESEGVYTFESVEGVDGWDAYAQMVAWQRAGLAPGLDGTPDGLLDVRGLAVYDPSVDLADYHDQLCGVVPFRVLEHDDTSVTVHVPVGYQQPLLRLGDGCCHAVVLPEGEPWDSFDGPTPPMPPWQTNLRAPLFAAQLGDDELAEVGAWQLDDEETEPEDGTEPDGTEPADG